MALWGGLLFQKQYEEGQREDAAAVVALNKLGETANEKLTSARAAIAKGNLDEAAALLSKDFIDQLNKEPTLADESFQFTEYRDDLLKFQKLETDFKEIASRQINTFDITSPISFDIPALKKAIEPYLPDGLTEAGIEKLRRDLDESTLTHEQRLVVGDKLIEAVYLDIIERDLDLIDKQAPESDPRYDELLGAVKLLDKLGQTCKGIDDGTHGWVSVCEYVNRVVYGVRGDKHAVKTTYSRQGLTENQRAISFSLLAFTNERTAGGPIPSQATLGLYETTLTIDPTELKVEAFLGRALQRRARIELEDTTKRFLYSRAIESYQDAKYLAPHNAYIHGQLLLALHEAWILERAHTLGERITAMSHAQGPEAGKRAIELCHEMGIKIPTDIWLAYGELAITGNQMDTAIQCLENVLNAEPDNKKAQILLATVDIEHGGLRFSEDKLRSTLKASRNDDTLSPLYLPEMAAIYTMLSKQADLLGDSEKENFYKTAALDCLEDGISKIKHYRSFIPRKEVAWFSYLTDNLRYKNLFK